MRVRGSKRRVHLTEVDLEPTEQKPMLRIAPAAASMIWLGSIGLATAIYMEWLPARALFESETPARSELRTPDRQRPRATPRSVAASEKRAAPASEAARVQAPVRAATDSVAPPAAAKITTPAVVPESSRTIRGSYYSDDSNWAGGW